MLHALLSQYQVCQCYGLNTPSIFSINDNSTNLLFAKLTKKEEALLTFIVNKVPVSF